MTNAARASIPQGASPSQIQQLRYFNNGIEVDINGRPVSSQHAQNASSAATGSSNPTAQAPAEDSKKMSQFVELVLSLVPEMSHIMTGFVSSVNMKREAGIAGPLNEDLHTVVDMALAELKSIDDKVLESIDPKTSDFASRIVRCISGKNSYQVSVMFC